MNTMIAFNTGTNPVHTGVYIVDRGDKLGTPLRWFNAETQFWSRCEYTLEDILNAKDKVSGLGFLPWRGPIKVTKPVPAPAPIELVGASEIAKNVIQQGLKAKSVKAPKVKVAKAPKAPKVVKAPKVAKIVNTAPTVTFNSKRGKWMASYNGKNEAARPTKEAALSFLQKKYDVVGTVIETTE